MNTRTMMLLLAAVFALTASVVNACAHCDHITRNEFAYGNQHPDCQYATGLTRQGPPSEAQDEIDHYWIRYAHEWGVANNPNVPFVGAIVNTTSNKLLCISVNQGGLSNPQWNWRGYYAHGETVAIENCTAPGAPLADITVNGKRTANPGWKEITLYGNIETCPMCFQASVWRGIRRMVFGARASALLEKRCWGQATVTVQELADQNLGLLNFTYLRGPLLDYEDTILRGFKNNCPSN